MTPLLRSRLAAGSDVPAVTPESKALARSLRSKGFAFVGPTTAYAAMQACGCKLNNAYMQHSLLALVVIPELRISDVGLIDVTQFAPTDLFVG